MAYLATIIGTARIDWTV